MQRGSTGLFPTTPHHSLSYGQPQHNGPTTQVHPNVQTARDGDIGCIDGGVASSETPAAVKPVADSVSWSPTGPPPPSMPQPDAGKKFDSGKPPVVQGMWAYFSRALEGVAKISAYGANKYKVAFTEQNWRKVENAKGRYADALGRHLGAYLRGELIDIESGELHIDMMAWNALAISELEKTNADR